MIGLARLWHLLYLQLSKTTPNGYSFQTYAGLTFEDSILNDLLPAYKTHVKPLNCVAGSETPPHLCIIKQKQTTYSKRYGG